MSAIERCIKEAVESGYNYHSHKDKCDWNPTDHHLLDPLFWQALGKARGWPNDWAMHETRSRDNISGSLWKMNCPRYHWHRFIDHRASDKTAEEFFAELV